MQGFQKAGGGCESVAKHFCSALESLSEEFNGGARYSAKSWLRSDGLLSNLGGTASNLVPMWDGDFLFKIKIDLGEKL